jgi:hypothetical protein
MGQEARCTVRLRDRVSEGKALLETNELVFRGDDEARLKVPFKEMRAVQAANGELRFESAGGLAVLELGPLAEKWAQKILHPKSLLDKLGVKAGMRVLVLGVEDEGFMLDLRARTDEVVFDEGSPSVQPSRASGRTGRGLADAWDMVFLGIDEPEQLVQLSPLKGAIKRDGAVWAVVRKGRKDFNENDVLRGGLEAGLVDVKVVRFSGTHAASKFVIRKAER